MTKSFMEVSVGCISSTLMGLERLFLEVVTIRLWSPDGTKIAYIADDFTGNFFMWVINADGTGKRQLNFNGYYTNGEFFSWSPDSQKIVFGVQEINTLDSSEIYVVNADGTGLTKLTTNSVEDASPQWSPDGQKIIFMSRVPGQGRRDLFTMSPDGSNRTQITNFAPNASAEYPQWSPDGKKIAFSAWSCCAPPAFRQLWTMDANGGNQKMIESFQDAGSNSIPQTVWSHDSSQIGIWINEYFGANVFEDFIINADGGTPVMFAINNSAAVHDWSPDDSQIVYANGDPYISGDLYIATEDGARTKIDFLPNGISHFGRPRWRPRPPCNCTAIARPTPQFIQSNWTDPENKLNWSMNAEVTDRDGLVLTNVKLGPRKLAEKISVPYYNLDTAAFSGRGELKPNDVEADGTRRSRLIDFQVTQDADRLVVEATYVIDQIPSGAASCVYVTQRYEFYHEGVGGPCEPSEKLTCSRWKPIVRYKFFGQYGQKLNSFTIPQRRHFTVDDNINNSVGLFKDCDSRIGCLPHGIIFERKENPLFDEWYGRVIENGAGNNVWDNIHQTQFDSVDEPGIDITLQNWSLKAPGCPECMHSHWRWTAVEGKPWGDGKVFGIPPGSKQTFELAVVRSNSGEEHPDNFSALANYERIRHPATGYDPPRQVYDYSAPDDVAVWYSGTGVQNRDSFFGFGIFFSASVPNQLLSLPSGQGFTTSATSQPSLNPPNSDGISSILVANLYENGSTQVMQFDPSIIGILPANYVVYNGLSFDVKTAAEVSGPDIVTFTLPSASDPTLFSNLRIFHAEQDPFDPNQVVWVDRTIMAPDSPAPDFLNRTISARTRLLGPFLVALQTSPSPAQGAAELTLTTGHSPAQVMVGNDVTYNVTVANGGPDAATGVRFVHELPPNSQFISVAPSQGNCSYANGRVVCKLGSIDASANATVAVTATLTDEGLQVPAQGKTVNSTFMARATENDSNLNDNTVTEGVTLLPNSNAAPTVSITSPVSGGLFVGPANITFTMTAADSDGSVNNVELFDAGNSTGLASLSSGNQYSLNWTGAPFGKHSLIAVATDNGGRQGKSDPVNIIVNGSVNISLVDPAAYREYSTTAPSTIVADATLSGGSISKVEFYANGQLIGQGTVTSPNRYSCTWVHPYTGNYSLEAVATDNSGVTTTSPSVNVNVRFNTAPGVSIVSPLTGSAFATPANITLTANATDSDGWISAVDFYANGSKIGTGSRLGSNQFNFTWSNPAAGSYSLTAIAVDDAAESTTSTPINIAISAAPSVSLTAPANGAQYAVPATVGISATASDSDGSIARVDFYSNGGLLGSGTFSGGLYNLTWSNVVAGNYTLTAKAIDNSGVTTTSSAISITVKSAALFVVGSTTLTASDAVVKTRLEALNNIVTVKDAASATTADANGKALVVISSTVNPASVGTKYRTVTVPVMTWESGLFTNMGMTGSTNKDFGTKTNQTQLTITNSSHPLAAGLSGNVSVVSSSKTFDWGKPNANAIAIATIANDSTKTTIFGYEAGAVMPGLTAPARRLAFFLFDDTAASLNANGTALLDAAIKWIRGGGSISSSLSTSPPSSVDLTTEGVLDWAHWGLTGPTAFNHKGNVTQQISNVTNIGTGTVGWFADSSTTCSWTDGTPTLTASNTALGINVNGAVGNGFEITVPADTNLRTLNVYLGVWYAQGKLEASLSDGSAPTYVDTGLNNNGGGTFGFYTINFKAGSVAQTVKVRFTMLNQYFSPNGNLAWRAATLR